jgi:hypothetical protein
VQLFCSIRTPVLTKLDVWPALPIVIEQHYFRKQKLDNLIAAMKLNDRICKIDFDTFFDAWQLEKFVSLMQVPFPALTILKLSMGQFDVSAPVLPYLFLGRSAPRLQHLKLKGFSFPELPNLLLSTTGLVSLDLQRIPHSWYIAPDVMVTYLSALTGLKYLILGFESRLSRPDRESLHSPPASRTLIPTLTLLKFEGAYEYAEDLVARIDTPQLYNFIMIVFKETVYNISHLSHFISRRVPKFQSPDKAHVTFIDDRITATLFLPASRYGRLVFGILSDESAGQLSSLIQLFMQFSPAFATVERLCIRENRYCSEHRWKRGIEYSHWLLLLRFFASAKDLYISGEITTHIVSALGRLVGKRTTEVLPALQNLLLEEYEELPRATLEGVQEFVDARKLSGHPIAVSDWI